MKNTDYYEYENDIDNDIEIIDTKTVKQRVPLTHRTWAKVIAFITAVIMTVIAVFSVIFVFYMFNYDIYSTPKEETVTKYCDEFASNVAWEINDIYVDEVFCNNVCQRYGIAECKIYLDNQSNTDDLVYTYKSNSKAVYNYDFYHVTSYDYFESIYYGSISLAEDSLCFDFVYLIDFAYFMMYKIYAVLAISVILIIASLIFLLCASGHKKGYSQVKPGWGTKIPFDLLFLLTAGIVVGAIIIIVLLVDYGFDSLIEMIIKLSLCTFTGIVGLCAVFGLLMSFALRVKLGKWWKNTIIYRALKLLWKGIKFFFKLLIKIFNNISLIYITILSSVVIFITGFLLIIYCNGDIEILIIPWILFVFAITFVAVYCTLAFNKLKKSANALAKGDLSYNVDTKYLVTDFKAHADSLNNIAKGMSIAVEDRLKSERMKTELITNVSHDIKTPLTSIINYTDLISKEECNNEKIYEYSEVLLRQSDRLKRLIDDLVEASKASTGNLEILLAPCEANIILTQTVGEYEEKLKKNNLQLIVNQPDEPITILADGRRLWRVFDNLLNNICKYAQDSTRVYLSVEEKQDQAVITFRNISGTPLNMYADELVERFVRGDSSRNSEGNGLGLSIAKSLTELQNGKFDLIIDGDLFKVVLTFPKFNN